MSNSSDDEMPELEELNVNQKNNQNLQNDSKFQDFSNIRNQEFIENQKRLEEKLQQQLKKEEELKNKELNQKNKGLFETGLKKGFFNSQIQKKNQKEQEIQVISKPKSNQNENPLKIKEVQEAMEGNNFLLKNKDQWLNNDLLSQISQNPKLIKLFTNPQYMDDMQLMQKNPKEIQQKYANNLEFQELFKEFNKTMSGHFSKLAEQNEQKANQQQQQQMQQQQLQQQIIQDPEINKILQDNKVRSLLEYMQKTQKVDFHRVMQSDPDLAQKIQILIKKGYLNIER